MIELSSSQIEYLRAIFIISKTKKVSVTGIADYLNCTKPSVVRGLKKLADLNLIIYNIELIELTDKGKKYANNIMRKDDIIHIFFTEILHINEEQASIDAKKIKNVVSCYTITKLEKYIEEIVKEKISKYNDYCICEKDCNTCLKEK